MCIREVQNTIKESVLQLLSDKIKKLGLEDYFEVLINEIRGINGSLIIFRGMQEYNSDNIKSLEGFDIAWVEEAQSLSARSWRMLRPTIRNPGSEIWCSWNPRHKFDPVDEFFRGENKHPEAVAVFVGWKDNPWFPEELKKEMDFDYASDPVTAEHVWGGGYEVIGRGSYYANLLAVADKEGRISGVPYDPKVRVSTGWDIGVHDMTSIWFAQIVGKEIRIIDFYENCDLGADHYAKVLASKPYVYHQHLLPHDAAAREKGTGLSYEEQLISLGLRPTIVPRQSIEDGIAAVRAVLPKCWFDKVKCERGIDALRLYRKTYDERNLTYRSSPVHDWASHPADAFRYLTWGIKEYSPQPKKLQYPKRKIV